jgi:hypothetical protein
MAKFLGEREMLLVSVCLESRRAAGEQMVEDDQKSMSLSQGSVLT